MPRGAARRRRLYLGGNDRLSKHRRGIDQSPGWDLGLRHRAQPGRRRRDRHAKYDGKPVYRAIVIARPDLEIKKWPADGKGRRMSFTISSSCERYFHFRAHPLPLLAGVDDRRGVIGEAAKIRNHANAIARPQMPLTISALTAPTDAAALLGERPFSGKMTNQVIKVGGTAPRQTAPTQ